MELNTLVTEPDYSLLNSEFTLPEVPQNTPTIRPKDATEEAFFAVNPGSSDPVKETIETTKNYLEEGQSAVIDAARSKWLKEQDESTRKVIGGLLEDQSVDKKVKIEALKQYALGGYVSNDLKDKYIEKVAISNPDSHKDDVKAQNANIDKLPTKLMLSINKKQDKVLENFANEIQDKVIAQATKVDFKNPTAKSAHIKFNLDLLKDTKKLNKTLKQGEKL